LTREWESLTLCSIVLVFSLLQSGLVLDSTSNIEPRKKELHSTFFIEKNTWD